MAPDGDRLADLLHLEVDDQVFLALADRRRRARPLRRYDLLQGFA